MSGAQVHSTRLGVLLEDPRPIQARKAIGEPLRFGDVLDPEQDIVVLGIAEVMDRESPCEPLVPMKIARDRQGKPGLKTPMDEAKVAIHEVEVQVQTLAPGGLNEEPPCLEAEGESAAGFEDGEDTHQMISARSLALGASTSAAHLPLCAATSSSVAANHSRTVLSPLPLARVLPSGEKATELTESEHDFFT